MDCITFQKRNWGIQFLSLRMQSSGSSPAFPAQSLHALPFLLLLSHILLTQKSFQSVVVFSWPALCHGHTVSSSLTLLCLLDSLILTLQHLLRAPPPGGFLVHPIPGLTPVPWVPKGSFSTYSLVVVTFSESLLNQGIRKYVNLSVLFSCDSPRI